MLAPDEQVFIANYENAIIFIAACDTAIFIAACDTARHGQSHQHH